MYKFISLLQESTDIETNDSFDITDDNIEYIIENSYYDTLYNIRKDKYNQMIEYKNFILESGISDFFNDFEIKKVTRWFGKLSRDFTKYYIKYSKSIEWKMNMIEKYVYYENYGQKPVKVDYDMYTNFLRLPFDKNIDNQLMFNMDLRKEKSWLYERDIDKDLWIRQFPKWVYNTKSINTMKEYILDNSEVDITSKEYNIAILYPKVKKYKSKLREEYKSIYNKFEDIKTSLRSLSVECKQTRDTVKKYPNFNSSYGLELERIYTNNYMQLVEGIFLYQRSMYYIIIDMCKKLDKIITRMYGAIPIKDRFKYSKFDNTQINTIQREMIKGV